MYYVVICIHVFLVLFLQPFSAIAQSNGTVPLDATLTASKTTINNPWISPSGYFAMGFQQVQNDELFLLCIWYYQLPDQTVVWYANGGNPVQNGSTVQLQGNLGLVFLDPQGNRLWSSTVDNGPVSSGFMNDTGNFVLKGSGGVVNVWESFDNPTDTILPGQVLGLGQLLVSRYREANFSTGKYQFGLSNNQSLELIWNYGSYTIISASSSAFYNITFNETGNVIILGEGGQSVSLTTTTLPGTASQYYYRATLNFDGVFSQYSHPKVFSGSPNWTSLCSQPSNICSDVTSLMGSGACGYNSLCSIDSNSRAVCGCPQGYSLLDPNDVYSGCNANYNESCSNGSEESSQYEIIQLNNTDWPDNDYESLAPYSQEECIDSCLNDCLCAVAIMGNGPNTCWKKRLPLSNGRTHGGSTVFLKIAKGGPSPPNSNPPSGKRRNSTLVAVGSALLGTSVFVNVAFFAVACFGYLLIRHKRSESHARSREIMDINLRCFTYKELEHATSGFKEELGRGAFGIVYKGVVRNVAVAVKKLDRAFQDSEKEFITEINSIAQTHHKNLCRLLGYCDEGLNRLLVYEYMSNGTLASYLFGDEKLDWDTRTSIALGIARGLSYLHEECSVQIIHCDIKPQNVLLDDNFNARISDFGLAKLLMVNQSRTCTAIRGTKGYVAPEWFRNIPVTPKVDVYSFGVLLLEMITCRKSLMMDLEEGEGKEILGDWVWDCFQEGRLDALLEGRKEGFNDWEKLGRFVRVGIWCTQENPSLRPTMRKVIRMLEGVEEIKEPPCPVLFSYVN